MATKKQKRQAGIERYQNEMETVRQEGLQALQKEQERRRQAELDEWRENHTKNHSWTKRIKECPHCRIEMAAAKHAQRVLQTTGASA